MPGSFEGFSSEAMAFLRGLAKHNDRTWFTPRKELYQRELLEPLQALILDATAALRKAKIPIGGDPKRGAFRIYRDIRFSADKSPYKTNLGAYLAPTGGHSTSGGIYIHIQPKASFIVAAFYELDKEPLLRWREAMAQDAKRFAAVLKKLDANGVALHEQEDALKRMPRGFEAQAESPLAKYFRWRSFTVSEGLTDADVMNPRLVERIVALAKNAKPLLDFGWSALAG